MGGVLFYCVVQILDFVAVVNTELVNPLQTLLARLLAVIDKRARHLRDFVYRMNQIMLRYPQRKDEKQRQKTEKYRDYLCQKRDLVGEQGVHRQVDGGIAAVFAVFKVNRFVYGQVPSVLAVCYNRVNLPARGEVAYPRLYVLLKLNQVARPVRLDVG